MEFYHYQSQCSPLSTSSQNSSTSSSDDELGLKGLVQGVYAPYLTAELERLFVAEVPIYVTLSCLPPARARVCVCVCGWHPLLLSSDVLRQYELSWHSFTSAWWLNTFSRNAIPTSLFGHAGHLDFVSHSEARVTFVQTVQSTWLFVENSYHKMREKLNYTGAVSM